jgi:hypothetical protein
MFENGDMEGLSVWKRILAAAHVPRSTERHLRYSGKGKRQSQIGRCPTELAFRDTRPGSRAARPSTRGAAPRAIGFMRLSVSPEYRQAFLPDPGGDRRVCRRDRAWRAFPPPRIPGN